MARATRNQLTLALMGAIAVLAWINFAERPTARNLRVALQKTLPLV